MKIEKNRIICENFYGRMKKLFKIIEGKFKWDEESCSTVFKVCAAHKLSQYEISLEKMKIAFFTKWF